jgi:integrase
VPIPSALAIWRLREVCGGAWTLTFIDTSLAAGARRGELLALEWPDIDWLTSTVTIGKSLEQTAAGLRTKRPKSDRVRKFRLGKTVITLLRFLNEQAGTPSPIWCRLLRRAGIL